MLSDSLENNFGQLVVVQKKDERDGLDGMFQQLKQSIDREFFLIPCGLGNALCSGYRERVPEASADIAVFIQTYSSVKARSFSSLLRTSSNVAGDMAST